jgi:hypothetical protein
MLSTAEQAKKQWCPFARATQKQVAGYNRVYNTDEKPKLSEASFCIANQCSAWRWKTARSTQDIDLVTGDTVPRLGFCGLSGPARFAD